MEYRIALINDCAITEMESFCFKIDSPSRSNMFDLIINVTTFENMELTLNEYDKCIMLAEGNIKKVLWFLQMKKWHSLRCRVHCLKIII